MKTCERGTTVERSIENVLDRELKGAGLKPVIEITISGSVKIIENSLQKTQR